MKKIISAAALVLLTVGSAQAQFYVGGNLGRSHLGLGCSGGVNCDDSATSFKLSAGYADDEIPHGAVELSYIGFGKGKTRVGTANVNVKSQALVLAGGIHADFTARFGGIARVGVAAVKTRCGYAGSKFSSSETKAAGYLGLGLDFAFTKNIKAVAALDLTSGECGGETGGLRMLSLGGQYTF
ncbi:outer membrane beta-barrel protein [Aquabacterium sp.]|uniref:outer membrane beta-barrel protein n=1 Tax=Aquabacterium sp. TaxID=1872578 RepID=UPI003D6CDA6E